MDKCYDWFSALESLELELWVNFPAAAGNYAIPSTTKKLVDTTKIPYS